MMGAMTQTPGAEADIPVIELVHPMAGFPNDGRFALVQLDDDGVLHGFRSLDSEGLQFVVIPPAPFFPDYAPELADEVAGELGLDAGSADGDVIVLLVVRAGTTLADTTVNLRAPLVINTVTRRASQVVLDDADLSITAPLVA